MSFSTDIAKYAKKAGAALDEAARAVKIELFTGVITDTRVDTGRLRGNWQTSVGEPRLQTIERLDKTIQGAPGGAAYDDAVSTPRGDTVDYLSNNLPYANIWEDRDGMIARSVTRVLANIKRLVKA